MILPIAQALPPDLIKACQQLATQDKLFVDGRSTAGWYARDKKHNQQAKPDTRVRALLAQVETALLGHELIIAAGRPKTLIRLLLSRYEPGMHYDNHIDDALLDKQRADLSFTLFLSDPGSYEGGELVIDEPAAERSFKLEAGSLLLYPSTTLHRVEPVRSGRRLVLVGWLRSFIRQAQQRELLFDLDRSIAGIRGDSSHEHTLALMLKTRSNLLRMWAED
ncbi:MAG: Fe2+-dependent dioxygenase [Pseudomonadales bacterium]|nr:Fe2+-dependent dioxygenase [Pseudomonadales bacterium]